MAGDLIRVNKRELVIPVDDGAGRGHGDTILVTNVAENDIAFKMKTTNPNRYIVRPNVACVPRGETIEIRVLLSDVAPVPDPGASKDRFQLRVALAPGLSESLSPAEFWRAHEEDEGQLRIRFVVKFIPFVVACPRATPIEPEAAPDADALLAPGNVDDAVQKVCELQAKLQSRNVELARVKTELRETIAEKDRTLREAPAAPLAANRLVSDPFGGLSVISVGLVLVVVLLLLKLFL